jgi:uncharacterized protein
MSDSLKFIDSDAHVIEPRDMFERYLEPKYRAQMPVAWAGYQVDPLALGLEVRIPKPSGGEYVMPFGDDPLTGLNRIDTHSRSAALGGSPVALPEQDEAYAEFARQGFPPEMYKLAMERASIDYMVVYPSTGLLMTSVPDLSADTAAVYRRAYNNWLHDFCGAAGGRVIGVAAVDLRDAEEAAREARRCVKKFDFKAVYINPVPVGEHRLYDDFYEPLWNTLEDLDVPLAVHAGTGTIADQMLYHYLPRLRTAQTTVAFTMGNMLACTALIMGGVLEQHPRLRVVHLESERGGCRFGSTDSPPVSRAGSGAWTSLVSRCFRWSISNGSVSFQRIQMTQASSTSSTISGTTTS